jgi:hypothetical protein
MQGDTNMSEEKSSGFSAKKGCLWIGGVVGGLVILGAVFGGGDKSVSPQNNSPVATNAEKAATVDEVVVTAKELAKAYEENEAAAQLKYGDKPLAVTGIIKGITLDLMDNPVVQLSGANDFLPVQGNLADKDAAAALKKGQKVTLHCESVTEVVSAPMLQDCRL